MTDVADVAADTRRERIVSMVLEHEFVRVTDLAGLFGVTSVTIRADLELLDRQGSLRRVRGGAIPARPVRPAEPSFEVSLGSAAVEKTRLARHAAGLVASGESLVIDAGTTTTFLARALVARPELTDVVVFTNSLRVAVELEPAIPRITVLLTGGTLRPATHALVDPLGALMLDRINADTLFLACHGVDAASGITGVNLLEAEMKRKMLGATRRHVVVADSSKLGRTGLAPVCALSEVDMLITGREADPGTVGVLRDEGIAVELVD
ncbi:DeoR family transcriptional regulator [Herbidospora sp. NEAU-GS84]|uniref:DeoR family transcriptional regulator n=1 Tax=Herbidospora solisilvae TaxID=2696284 RepID=A0A7C9JR27_9ACTN|nr:DeoR/GlpR family DNA-binding transcription regulator [Herbidospora solisilvae]NAS20939.1 DeoR family transcriptional regulator [Herbidospora solisilvae]